uniref:Glabrous enhancer-binding protein-like DBD domain-containing protein n=1 Tax=Oryza brachyantha TaxID=4533 RepID=J3ME44_ORYBR
MAGELSRHPPSASFDAAGPAASAGDRRDPSSGGSSGSGASGAKKKPSSYELKWCPADEISILEAASSHRQRHGQMPAPDDLLAALRGRLLTETRIDARAISRLLKSLHIRYGATWNRISSRGVVPVKDHDLKIYRLSKSLWGADRGRSKMKMMMMMMKKKKKKKKKAIAHHEPRELWELEALYPCLAAEVEVVEASGLCPAAEGMFRRSFARIGDEKAAVLEAKARKVRLAEVKVRMQREELTKEVAETFLDLFE